jgi:hypothetical protein
MLLCCYLHTYSGYVSVGNVPDGRCFLCSGILYVMGIPQCGVTTQRMLFSLAEALACS